MTKQLAWSHSALETFDSCPYKFWRLKIAKDVKEDAGAAANEGKKLHAAFEKFINHGADLPPSMAKYLPKLEALRQRSRVVPVKAEEKMAINQQFAPTSWFANDAWGRAISDVTIDYGHHVIMMDWKFGKVRDSWMDQSKVLAVCGFVHYPNAEKISCVFEYLKEGHEDTKDITFSKANFPTIFEGIGSRLQRLQAAVDQDHWPCQPTKLCGWCPVTDCTHWYDRG